MPPKTNPVSYRDDILAVIREADLPARQTISRQAIKKAVLQRRVMREREEKGSTKSNPKATKAEASLNFDRYVNAALNKGVSDAVLVKVKDSYKLGPGKQAGKKPSATKVTILSARREHTTSEDVEKFYLSNGGVIIYTNTRDETGLRAHRRSYRGPRLEPSVLKPLMWPRVAHTHA